MEYGVLYKFCIVFMMYIRCLYIWFSMHVGYAVLCMDDVMYMLDMQCCVWMVLCKCWICSAMYTWCCAHVLHMVLCTYGVVCMTVQVVM